MNLRRHTPFIPVAGLLVASALAARADAILSVNDFATQMSGWNVITSGAFSTNSHVHGHVAVGGTASLNGAEINNDNLPGEALRVYGDLKLSGTSRVMAGGATILQNGTVNSSVVLHPGKPNPNQAVINTSSNPQNGSKIEFNGNGGVTPTLTSLGSDDGFFSSRDAVMQAANSSLLGAGTGGARSFDQDTIYFDAASAGVSVFNWNIDTLKGINEVGFTFVPDSFIVVNILGASVNSVWNATFNILGGSDFLADHVLWNIGVGQVRLTGSELLGSILAPDSVIKSEKQLKGSIYAAELQQRGQQIHNHVPQVPPPPPPHNVPDAPSFSVVVMAGLALLVPAWARRKRQA